MPNLNRRAFLSYSAGVTGTAVAGFAALEGIASWRDAAAARRAGPRLIAGLGEGGYGPLVPAGPELALPEGFSYRVFGIEGSPMTDGRATPGAHDGMCALPLSNGNIRLIRNHEVANTPAAGAAIGSARTAYDVTVGGGTTSLEIDPVSRELIRDFVSLSGTLRNCAGGPTPWGSWLTCEEAFFGQEVGFYRAHGYIFEVPAAVEEQVKAEPLVAMGRFVHEAVAVDPATGIVYETEDSGRAGLYRFIPNEPYRRGEGGNLAAGGRLQMLAIGDRPRYDTATGQTVGESLPVVWVDIEHPDPPGGRENLSAVFEQGWSAGGARFSRLEGCWYGDGNIYLIATSGGDARVGQVWQYQPLSLTEGELALVFESPHRRILSGPDNVCVSPRGGVVLCEDGSNDPQYVRGLTRDGRIFDVAANLADDGELAGATFSPDGRTLFFNVQGNTRAREPGMTFAVWGPWERGAL